MFICESCLYKYIHNLPILYPCLDCAKLNEKGKDMNDQISQETVQPLEAKQQEQAKQEVKLPEEQTKQDAEQAPTQ